MMPAMFKSVLLFDMPGGTEWILIILAVLVLFGGKKIPEFMRGLGRGIREFNDAKTNVKKEIEEGMKENASAPAASAPAATAVNNVPSTEKAH
jgi:sec-independent protein translocase protein TatA